MIIDLKYFKMLHTDFTVFTTRVPIGFAKYLYLVAKNFYVLLC